MAKTGPARPETKDSGTNEDAGELDETLENLTIGVAKAAKINATPIVIGVVVLLGLIMLPTLLDKLKEQELQQWNNEIEATFAGEVAEVRALYPTLLDKVRGQAIETIAIEKVARWLWDQGDDASRQQAVVLLEQSQQRFPDDYVIGTYLQQFRTSQQSSEGFVLPEPAPPEETETAIPAGDAATSATDTKTDDPANADQQVEIPKPTLTTEVPDPPPTEAGEKPDPKPLDLGPPPPTTGGDGN